MNTGSDEPGEVAVASDETGTGEVHGEQDRGLGSRAPVPGVDPPDPANRRIEVSVLAPQPIEPTPVDKPGPR